eukprot:m.63732 g.63732  ORF g.63732 m.63732 type:complete len:380 (+) comp8085_c4_seq1:51-1190(+)
MVNFDEFEFEHEVNENSLKELKERGVKVFEEVQTCISKIRDDEKHVKTELQLLWKWHILEDKCKQWDESWHLNYQQLIRSHNNDFNEVDDPTAIPVKSNFTSRIGSLNTQLFMIVLELNEILTGVQPPLDPSSVESLFAIEELPFDEDGNQTYHKTIVALIKSQFKSSLWPKELIAERNAQRLKKSHFHDWEIHSSKISFPNPVSEEIASPFPLPPKATMTDSMRSRIPSAPSSCASSPAKPKERVLLGHGLFGHVYDAVYDGRHQVAVKEMKLRSPSQMKFFIRGISVLSASAQHPRLVQTLGGLYDCNTKIVNIVQEKLLCSLRDLLFDSLHETKRSLIQSILSDLPRNQHFQSSSSPSSSPLCPPSSSSLRSEPTG